MVRFLACYFLSLWRGVRSSLSSSNLLSCIIFSRGAQVDVLAEGGWYLQSLFIANLNLLFSSYLCIFFEAKIVSKMHEMALKTSLSILSLIWLNISVLAYISAELTVTVNDIYACFHWVVYFTYLGLLFFWLKHTMDFSACILMIDIALFFPFN